jgi:hypothetical protein
VQSAVRLLNQHGNYEGQSNGSKTAVMDVIGFLCVSLGSRTNQLHESIGSRGACSCSEAGFSSQNGDVFEEYITEDLRSVVHFLWAKGLNIKGYS